LFATIRDRSIAEQSEALTPPRLADPRLVQTGLQHYHEMCVTCHGAPGRAPSEIGQGLNPPPPKLYADELQNEYSESELFWIIKHGIRMTGMPAFGPTHTDEDVWALVAFVHRLSQMTPQDYRAMVEAAGLQETNTESHQHEHTHGTQHEALAEQMSHR
jgi:mono/diheme cytochrome c family protein